MNRTPPKNIRQILRQQVGFICPIPDCMNPYLEWHHFDPPWREREHHDPDGMIALCAEHHQKADAGAFTKDQLKLLKMSAGQSKKIIGGRFDWLRRDILVVIGGSFFYDVEVALRIFGRPVVWFRRDDDHNLLLNVSVRYKANDQRLEIENNDWLARGNPVDLESPPSGRLISVKYSSGDYIRVEFFVLKDKNAALKRYPMTIVNFNNMTYPTTILEIHFKDTSNNIEFSPGSNFINGLVLGSVFSFDNPVGMSIF